MKSLLFITFLYLTFSSLSYANEYLPGVSKFIDETCKGIITASIFLLLNIDVKRVGAFT